MYSILCLPQYNKYNNDNNTNIPNLFSPQHEVKIYYFILIQDRPTDTKNDI